MKSLALLLAFALVGAISASGFGEFAGPLNFTLGIGGSQSKQWGIMNTNNYALNVSLVANPDPGGFVYVTVEPSHIELNASTILYANVTVSSPQAVEGSWSGTLMATAEPQSHSAGMVNLALSTIKKFNVRVEACSSFQLVSPYSGIVGAPCTIVANMSQLQKAGLMR